jgi:hypothetical protein
MERKRERIKAKSEVRLGAGIEASIRRRNSLFSLSSIARKWLENFVLQLVL